MSSNDIILAAEGVSKCFRLYDKPHHRLLQGLFCGKRKYYHDFWALQDINFTLHKGESLGVFGRNGAGKSTLLQIISRVLTPTTGTISVHGRIAALLELGSGFNPEFTGRENAYLNGAILGLSKEEMTEAMPKIESFADIGSFFDQPVKLYSSGMLVRVAFAVQTQVKPDILIVDEALAVGDIIFQKRCNVKMRELIDSGVSLIFVSHSEESLRLFTSKAILLEKGRQLMWDETAKVAVQYNQLALGEEEKYYAGVYKEYASSANLSPIAQKEETITVEAQFTRSTAGGDFGIGGVVIEEVSVMDGENRPSALLLCGSPMSVNVNFRFAEEQTGIGIALRIRNQTGVNIYLWGTTLYDGALPHDMKNKAFSAMHYEAERTYTMRFSTTKVCLGPGMYEIEICISKMGSILSEYTPLLWKTEAAFFSVTSGQAHPPFIGIADLGIQAVLLES